MYRDDALDAVELDQKLSAGGFSVEDGAQDQALPNEPFGFGQDNEFTSLIDPMLMEQANGFGGMYADELFAPQADGIGAGTPNVHGAFARDFNPMPTKQTNGFNGMFADELFAPQAAGGGGYTAKLQDGGLMQANPGFNAPQPASGLDGAIGLDNGFGLGGDLDFEGQASTSVDSVAWTSAIWR